ncbi:uncharacterized protein LOC123697354 [Colias croceus]|uniref:uncharacterized protein LOC123697354 n=1 Tax=Colias crocea TaxID=72248 RepID=UPI001E279DA2|nr:uncharacterized protein LOC123697354 [Colias croceus]
MDAENTELFLHYIRDYPVLYAIGHADYKNTYKKEVAWRKLQEKTQIDVKTMKNKWRNLRDTYKKYKQGQQTNSGQAAKKLANWQWAEQMSFIDSSTNLRQTEIKLDTSTISIKNENENSTEAEQVSNNEQNELVVQELETAWSTAETTAETATEVSRRRRHRVSNDVYLKTRKSGTTARNATENLVNIPCDRIDMDFLGYAHTVKKFSLQKQAIIKLQITQIITEAQLEELNHSRPNSNFSNA